MRTRFAAGAAPAARLALASALSLALGAALAGCVSPPTMGLEGRGVEVHLETDDPRLADSVAAATSVRLEQFDPAGLLDAAFDRAQQKAEKLEAAIPGLGAEVGALRKRATALDLEVEIQSFDPRLFLSSSASASGPAELFGAMAGDPGLRAPQIPPGKVLRGRLYLQVAPWPRDSGYVPHPTTLLAQSEVVYVSRVEGAADYLLAAALAEVAAERVAEEVAGTALGRGVAVKTRYKSW